MKGFPNNRVPTNKNKIEVNEKYFVHFNKIYLLICNDVSTKYRSFYIYNI